MSFDDEACSGCAAVRWFRNSTRAGDGTDDSFAQLETGVSELRSYWFGRWSSPCRALSAEGCPVLPTVGYIFSNSAQSCSPRFLRLMWLLRLYQQRTKGSYGLTGAWCFSQKSNTGFTNAFANVSASLNARSLGVDMGLIGVDIFKGKWLEGQVAALGFCLSRPGELLNSGRYTISGTSLFIIVRTFNYAYYSYYPIISPVVKIMLVLSPLLTRGKLADGLQLVFPSF